MSKFVIRTAIICFCGSVLLVILEVGSGLTTVSTRILIMPRLNDSSQSKIEVSRQNQESVSESVYITDFSDERKLIGAVHNVFVGQVLGEIGFLRQGQEAYTKTQYDVNVVLNIKGHLVGMIVVNVVGAGDRLEIGATYLFAAMYSPAYDRYTISIPAHDRIILSQDNKLSKDEILKISETHPAVISLKNAYPNEVLFDGFVRRGITYNSYASRCLDANGELIDDTVQIANEKKGLTKAECVTRLTPDVVPVGTPKSTPVPTARPKPTNIAPPPVIDLNKTPEPTLQPPPALPTM